MTKEEARKIADEFRKEFPELADRPCRIRVNPTSGFDAHTEWYLIPRGPRGGLRKSHYLTFATPGSAVFLSTSTGDIVLELNVVNRWKDYHTFVVLPFHETHEYQQPYPGHQLTDEEQLASAKWYKQFCEPEDLSWLDELILLLEEHIKYRDAPRCALCGEGQHSADDCPYYESEPQYA